MKTKRKKRRKLCQETGCWDDWFVCIAVRLGRDVNGIQYLTTVYDSETLLDGTPLDYNDTEEAEKNSFSLCEMGIRGRINLLSNIVRMERRF